MDRGELAQGVARAQEALAAAQRGGEARDLAAATENLGLMLLVQELDTRGERTPHGVERALDLLEESIGRFRALGDLVGAADALNNLGNGRLEIGDRAGAREALEEAVALQRDAGNALGLAFALNTLGYVALREGELEAAGERLAESLELFHDLGDVSRTGDTLEGIAEILARRGKDDCAARLWGAGAALRAEAGKEMEPSERVLHEESLARVRNRLGERALAETWAEGAALEPDEAVALGLSTARSLD
jgi:tetratricopeptide (TPR) repeat protein